MPSHNHFLISVLFVLISLGTTASWAQNSALEDIRGQRQQLQDERDILASRLQRQQADLEDARQSLEKTVTEMSDVFARAKTEPTDRNVRQATLISITHNRKLNRVERVENRIEDTRGRIDGIDLSLQKLTKSEISVKQQLAQQEKKRREQLRQAELAAKARQQKQSKQALPVRPTAAKQQVTATPNKAAPDKAAPIKKVAVLDKPQPQKIATRPSRKAGWPSLKQPHKDDIQFAKAALSAANKQLEAGDKPLLPKVTVIAKKSFGSKRMNYIGDDLYSVTAPLKAGNQKITLFKTDFWVDVPTHNNEQPHRIIYDSTSLSKPLLHIIPEELLTEQL